MPKARKSWQEKLAGDKGFPKVFKIDATKSKRWGTGTFVIPAPREVDALMRRVPKGKLTTIDELRRVLARRHGATIGCPITTGIFAWIAAHAATEAAAAGQKRTTPYWRTLKCGCELIRSIRAGNLLGEGHKIMGKGQRLFVVDFPRRLCDFQDHLTLPLRCLWCAGGSLRDGRERRRRGRFRSLLGRQPRLLARTDVGVGGQGAACSH
jgi:hypothetical protein